MLPFTKEILETLTRPQTCFVWDFPIELWNVQELSTSSADSLSSPSPLSLIDTSNVCGSDTETSEISSLEESSDDAEDEESMANKSTWTCRTCELVFEHHDAQRLHFQSELHRQTLVNELSLTNLNLNSSEDSTDEGQASSSTFSIEKTKGSRNTQQPSSRSTLLNSSPLLTFQFSNLPHLYFEMYYHILKLSKENRKISFDQLYSQLVSFRNTSHYVIYILFFGGSFFMAAFQNEKCIEHTSIKRYVTRRKQGGRQSTQDQKRHARSAGASLRRHNEQALFNEAVQALTSWSTTYFPRTDCLFYFMPSHNKRLLQHVPSTSFTCSIPCSVRKPSFNEIHRLHRILYSVQINPIQPSSPSLPPSTSVSPIPIEAPSPSITTETMITESQEEFIFINTPQKKEKKKPVSTTSNEGTLNVLDLIPKEETLNSSLPIPPSSWFQETPEFSKVLEREKRALAAEKRLRQSLQSSTQKSTSKPSLSSSSTSLSSSHCIQCEKFINQMPVKRHGYVFCSIPCASQWRKQNM